MPYELFRMRWCLEYGWKPWEFDQWDASDMEAWQDILAESAIWANYAQQLHDARQKRVN